MSSTDTLRNAELADLARLLQDQHARKLDVIVPASKLSSVGASLVVTGAEAMIEEDGVTAVDGTYRPTVVCDEGISDRLSIPVSYIKRLRSERPDLYDENVNGLLHGGFGEPTDEHGELSFYPADTRRFLLRTFSDGNGGGVARALLSDSFRIVDNLDVLTSALDGIRDAGVEVNIDRCDLTDRRMYVRVVCPQISALAPTLLAGYRSPFNNGVARAGEDMGEAIARWQSGDTGGSSNPVVFAGFVMSNSEVGGGAFTMTPQIVVPICSNGLTITKDALRAVHLGGKLDEGVIRWSHETQRKNLELVASQARDAVKTFLDVEYVTNAIAAIEEKAGVEITNRPVNEVVETVGKRLRFGDDHIAGVLDHFIRGGQMTAGGVVQAVTSFAQTIVDADVAHEFEAKALDALDLAVTLA